MHTYNAGDLKLYYNLTDDNFGGAFLASSLRVEYFNIVNSRKVKILKTKDYIRLLPFCMYFRKHSCLMKPFNRQISAYTSSGLINFWASAFRKSAHSKSDKKEPKPMSLHQVVGVIIVCSFLIAVSLIIFTLELLSTKFQAIKSSLDFLMSIPV